MGRGRTERPTRILGRAGPSRMYADNLERSPKYSQCSSVGKEGGWGRGICAEGRPNRDAIRRGVRREGQRKGVHGGSNLDVMLDMVGMKSERLGEGVNSARNNVD